MGHKMLLQLSALQKRNFNWKIFLLIFNNFFNTIMYSGKHYLDKQLIIFYLIWIT